MKPIKRLTAILLSAAIMFLFSGCWNYRELENLSMVSGVAIDKGQNGFKYHLTFEFSDLSSEKPASKLLETDGNTIFEAVRNAVGKSERKLYFSHCKIAVIDQNLAADGITPVFDWLLRDQEPRITIIPVISKMKTAGEILQQKGMTDQLTSMEIFKTITQNKSNLSESPVVQLYEAVDLLGGEGAALCLPAVKTNKNGKDIIAELDGTAVFKKDRLIGYLNPTDTKTFLFIRNEVAGGLLVFSPANDGQNITLEIKGNKTKCSPEVTDDKAKMNISISLVAAMAEDETSSDYVKSEGLEKLKVSSKKYLNAALEALIKKVQKEFDSDIFGFGAKFYQTNPEYWGKNKSKWDELFKTLPVSVDADINITNTATVKDKIKVVE